MYSLAFSGASSSGGWSPFSFLDHTGGIFRFIPRRPAFCVTYKFYSHCLLLTNSKPTLKCCFIERIHETGSGPSHH